MIRRALICALAVFAVGCAPSAAPTASQANPPDASAIATSPTPSPTESPSPAPPRAAAPAAAPQSIPVTFTGLPAGSYVTHLHSACNGAQAFHITVLQTLVVHAGGTGTIQVPTGDFGHGLCVIVYSSSSLSRVLTTRKI